MRIRQSLPARTQRVADVSSRDEIRQLFKESDEVVREFFEEFDTPSFSTTRHRTRRQANKECNPPAAE